MYIHPGEIIEFVPKTSNGQHYSTFGVRKQSILEGMSFKDIWEGNRGMCCRRST